MATRLLTANDSAAALGISVLTLYGWLSLSDAGEFELREQPVTIAYYQGGRRGQGRIRIEEQEVERIKDAMRVRPQSARRRSSPTPRQHYPGITVPLGSPDRID